jgi:hypothetical protein
MKLARNTLALVLLLVATLYAQGPRGGQRPQGSASPAMQLERLVKAMAGASVPLSDAQQTTILSVYQDAETAAKSDGSSSDEATRRQQMQSLQASVRKEVRALLTEDQAKVFDAMRQPGPPGANGGPGSQQGTSGSGLDAGPPSN